MPRLERALTAAHGYLELELPQRALEELRPVCDPGEYAYEFHLLRAEIYRALADWPAALDDFRVCYDHRPKQLDILMGLAWCYKRVDRLPQAIAAMHEAYESHSDIPVVLYNLACYYALDRQKQQSLSWLGRALRKDRGLLTLIPAETDFDAIRHDPDFHRLMDLVREKETQG
jgi:tetratricopeptide (TPR) repeat protein